MSKEVAFSEKQWRLLELLAQGDCSSQDIMSAGIPELKEQYLSRLVLGVNSEAGGNLINNRTRRPKPAEYTLSGIPDLSILIKNPNGCEDPPDNPLRLKDGSKPLRTLARGKATLTQQLWNGGIPRGRVLVQADRKPTPKSSQDSINTPVDKSFKGFFERLTPSESSFFYIRKME